MELINNVSKTLRDDILSQMESGSRVSIAASCFSIYAFQELKDIEEQIINREQRDKLLRQIDALEKRCRTEKQTRLRYELHQQIVKLKGQLAG